MPCKRENLIVLRYAFNECYTQVVSLEEPEVKKQKIIINELGGTWSRSGSESTFKIGEPCYPRYKCSYKIIGIYDRTKIEHLNTMVYAANEAVRDRSHDD